MSLALTLRAHSVAFALTSGSCVLLPCMCVCVNSQKKRVKQQADTRIVVSPVRGRGGPRKAKRTVRGAVFGWLRG